MRPSSHLVFPPSRLIFRVSSRSTRSSIAPLVLLISSLGTSAHPGLGFNHALKKGEPCPILGQKQQEEKNELRGQGYKQLPTRGLVELRAGHGGIPDGGFAAVEADLIDLMTIENSDWPTGEIDTLYSFQNVCNAGFTHTCLLFGSCTLRILQTVAATLAS